MIVNVAYYCNSSSKLYDDSRVQSCVMKIPFRRISKEAIQYIKTEICRDNALPDIAVINVLVLSPDTPVYRKDYISTWPTDTLARFIVDVAKYSSLKQASSTSRNVCRIIDSCSTRGNAVDAMVEWLESEAPTNDRCNL